MERKVALWNVPTDFERGVGVKRDLEFCNVNERPCLTRRILPVCKAQGWIEDLCIFVRLIWQVEGAILTL